MTYPTTFFPHPFIYSVELCPLIDRIANLILEYTHLDWLGSKIYNNKLRSEFPWFSINFIIFIKFIISWKKKSKKCSMVIFQHSYVAQWENMWNYRAADLMVLLLNFYKFLGKSLMLMGMGSNWVWVPGTIDFDETSIIWSQWLFLPCP